MPHRKQVRIQSRSTYWTKHLLCFPQQVMNNLYWWEASFPKIELIMSTWGDCDQGKSYRGCSTDYSLSLGWPASYDHTVPSVKWLGHQKQYMLWTSLVVQWLRVCTPNSGGLSVIPGEGTRPHMPELRVCMLQLKILHAKIERKKKTLHASKKIKDPMCCN